MAKIKRGEIKKINESIQRVSIIDASKWFGLGLLKNKNKIKEELEILDNLQKDLNEFEEKRLNLCAKYVDRDENNAPIIENEEFKGVAENPQFKIELIDLKNKYEKLFTEINSILEEEIEIDFYLINFEHFPEIIKPAEIEILSIMIKDTEIEEEKELEKLKTENTELKNRIAQLEQIVKDNR